ncbi:MAPEG family protein [Sphingomonas sp. BN140010]|uniref:MAPEG family protein n=1 Tax=Sphingomonas arvum TaxID=2992113 RepID=A0ABT3JEE3_9SPHN|nr:MAPEG family protein [Sphingomonas sp. BN140010]MCW3797442.1 MAPEG family protein [Sphingomonas sp. BN140010]
MGHSPLLGPVVALVAWSLVMLVWMAVARAGAFRRLGVKLSTIPRGSRGHALDQAGEDRAQWKAHNYNHLMEQPTIFYAIVLALAIMGFDAWINVALAWGYVGLRIAHSIVQATVNIVAIRLSLFILSTLCLLGLTLHAALALLH